MKNLKKLFWVVLLIATTISFASCSNDDDDEEPGSPYASTIIGTWKITHYGSTTYWVSWPRTTTTATFNSDGTYSGHGYFGNGSGTYKLVNSHITCYIDGQIYMQYDIISVSGDIAILEMYVGTDSTTKLTIKCKKQ